MKISVSVDSVNEAIAIIRASAAAWRHAQEGKNARCEPNSRVQALRHKLR